MNEKKEGVETEKKDEKLSDALLKVALGYQVQEVTEEYAEVDGALKLTKRKKIKKDVPPDLKAVQMLLESEGSEYAKWSDEELETEKRRLIETLRESEEVKKENGRGRALTKTKKTTASPRTKNKK